MSNRVIAIATAAAVFAAAPALHAQSGESGSLPTLAVADFDGFLLGEAGNSAPVGKAVSNMLITELSQREGIDVIERYRLQELLREQQLSLSGRVDASTMQEVGNLVGAGYLVFGQVSGVGNSMRMDVRLVDSETSEVLEVQKLTDSPEQLLGMVERIADMFMEQLDLEAPSERPEAPEIPTMATIHYSRAVDYADKGQTEDAIEQARKALEVYPDHRDAERLLERLQQNDEGGDR